jgi:hypothetical protein
MASLLSIIANDTAHMMNSRHEHVYLVRSQVRVGICDLEHKHINFVVYYGHDLL